MKQHRQLQIFHGKFDVLWNIIVNDKIVIFIHQIRVHPFNLFFICSYVSPCFITSVVDHAIPSAGFLVIL